jgi:branched-chain amino acid transport system substrate-binding protein
MKKWVAPVSLVLTALLVLTGCGNGGTPLGSNGSTQSAPTSSGSSEASSQQSAGSDDAIKIGFISSATGLASSQGKTEMDTAHFLEEKINQEGGINGKKVKIIAYDDESDETKAVLAMKKLTTQDKVSIVVGGTTTGNSLAMLGTAQSEKTPYISMAAGAAIAIPVKEYVFKTVQSDNLVMPSIFEYLKANQITKVAWMHINDAYGDSGHKFFKEMAPQYGIEIVAEETFNGSDTDMTAQLSKIKLKNPGAVVVWTRPPSGSVLTKNFKQLGFTIPLIHSHGMANKAFLEQAGDFAEGVILAGGKLLIKDTLPDSDPQKTLLVQFSKEFQEKVGYEPTNFSGYAYDGIMLAVEAIKDVGTDRAKIRDYLENNVKDFLGITGIYTFSPEDHTGLKPDSVTLIEIKGKNWTLYQK